MANPQKEVPSTQSIVEAAKSIKKPLVVNLYDLPEFASTEYEYLAQNRVPAYADAKRAAFALCKHVDYAEYARAN